MNVRATLVSNEQAAKTMKPGDGALDPPATRQAAVSAACLMIWSVQRPNRPSAARAAVPAVGAQA